MHCLLHKPNGSRVLMLLTVFATTATRLRCFTSSFAFVPSYQRLTFPAFVASSSSRRKPLSQITFSRFCASQGTATDQETISNSLHSMSTGEDNSLSATTANVIEDSNSNSNSNSNNTMTNTTASTHVVPLYRAEGIFAVYKPINWTSQDVVSYVRGILEREARERGANPKKVGSRGKNVIKVGHGGTLDPLATGVLVLGVGSGTKQMTSFLSGSKRYRTTAELGYETTTLDAAGTITKELAWDHVTVESIDAALPSFRGTIQQVPPIFSAIRKGGKRLYEEARKGKTEEDIEIEARPVEIYSLELVDREQTVLPKFHLDVECGGGTYIRSLVRDIAASLGTAATITQLERTKQGQFILDDALPKDSWSADNIYDAIEKCNDRFGTN